MKKIILILFVVLSTGCQIKYQLNFENENLIENIDIKLPNEEENKINDIKKYEAYSIFDNSLKKVYEVKYTEEKKFFNANYQYTYNFDEFRHALYINNCFDAFSFITSGNNYILSTSKGFNCMFVNYNKVDGVEITITTNHVIIENNADEVTDNKLIWKINDDNANDKSIYVKFGEVKQLNLFEKIMKFVKQNLFVFIVLGGIFLILVVGVIIIIFIGKKNNEI